MKTDRVFATVEFWSHWMCFVGSLFRGAVAGGQQPVSFGRGVAACWHAGATFFFYSFFLAVAAAARAAVGGMPAEPVNYPSGAPWSALGAFGSPWRSLEALQEPPTTPQGPIFEPTRTDFLPPGTDFGPPGTDFESNEPW